MNWNTIRTELCKEFTNVKWRMGNVFQSNNKYFGNLYAYIEAKDIEDRLDEVVGPNNWKNEFKAWHDSPDKYDKTNVIHSQLCGLSIYDDEKKEWITKWDGAQNKAIEGIKSGLTDSIKRAAAQWGPGRDVYATDQQTVEIYSNKRNVVGEQRFVGKLDKKGSNAYNYFWQEPQNVFGVKKDITGSSNVVNFYENTNNESVDNNYSHGNNNNSGKNNNQNQNQNNKQNNNQNQDNNNNQVNAQNSIHTGMLVKAEIKVKTKGGKYVNCGVQENSKFCYNFISNDLSIINSLNKTITVEIKKQGTYNIFEKIINVA